MASAAPLVTVALLLWAAGASIYTWQLWAARGLTDNGFLGLGVLILGSVAMAAALREVPMLAVCGLFPAYFAVAILVTKVRAMVRVRWHRPPPEMPVMLPKVPPAEERYEGTYAGIEPSGYRFWESPDAVDRYAAPDVGHPPPLRPVSPDIGQLQMGDEAMAKAEAERAQRVGRMFG